MVRSLFLAVALTALAAGTAVARDRADTEFTFLDENVRGDRAGSNVTPIHIRTGVMRRTLVRPRTHFVAEMRRSVEDL